MAQVTLAQGAEFDTSLALRAKVLSLYSLDTNTDAVRRMQKNHRLSAPAPAFVGVGPTVVYNINAEVGP